MNEQAMVELELMVDRYGLTAVCDGLIEICHDKADHIRSSYQDESLAQCWENAALQIANPDERFAGSMPT